MKLDDIPGFKVFIETLSKMIATILCITILLGSAVWLYKHFTAKTTTNNVVSDVKGATVLNRIVKVKKDGTTVINQTLKPEQVKVTTQDGRKKVTFYVQPDNVSTTESVPPIYKKKNILLGLYTNNYSEYIGIGNQVLFLDIVLLIGRSKTTDKTVGAIGLFYPIYRVGDMAIDIGASYSVLDGNQTTIGVRYEF